MLSHVHLGTDDFEAAFAFYSAVMAPLGGRLRFRDDSKPWAAWMPTQTERPLFIIGKPFDGQPAASGNGQMLALVAPSRAAVDQAHAAALANGGGCEGPPGLRPHYHADYYGAYFRDPTGNKVGVVCHDADAA